MISRRVCTSRHSVLCNHNRQIEALQNPDKEGEALREESPVPPFVRDTIQKAFAERAAGWRTVLPVLVKQIVPSRPAEHVSDERVVIIDGNVIEWRPGALGIIVKYIKQSTPGPLEGTSIGDHVMDLFQDFTRPESGP